MMLMCMLFYTNPPSIYFIWHHNARRIGSNNIEFLCSLFIHRPFWRGRSPSNLACWLRTWIYLANHVYHRHHHHCRRLMAWCSNKIEGDEHWVNRIANRPALLFDCLFVNSLTHSVTHALPNITKNKHKNWETRHGIQHDPLMLCTK